MRNQAQSADVKKKYNAGTNKQSQSIPNSAKLLESDTPPEVKRVDHSVGLAIQKKRAELGLSQKQLAEKICVKQTLIADFESGSAVIDQAVISKLERALKVRLRGANIGESLSKPTPAAKSSTTKKKGK